MKEMKTLNLFGAAYEIVDAKARSDIQALAAGGQIPSGGGSSGGSGGVSSWNDLTDKPFYEESSTVTLLDNTSFTMTTANPSNPDTGESFAVKQGIMSGAMSIAAGDKCTVTVNGVEHELTVFEESADGIPAMCLGDFEIMNSGTPVGDVNFLLFSIEAYGMVGFTMPEDAPETVTVSVTKDATVVHHIDEKFIPDTIARVEDVPHEFYDAIEWDGVIEGRESIDVSERLDAEAHFVHVSDKVLTGNDLASPIISMTVLDGSGMTQSLPVPSEYVQVMDDGCIMIAESIAVIPYDNYVLNGFVFPKSGVWFVRIEDEMYASKLTYTAVNPLEEKYLPSNIRSDWNETNSESLSYIKNKPFGREIIRGVTHKFQNSEDDSSLFFEWNDDLGAYVSRSGYLYKVSYMQVRMDNYRGIVPNEDYTVTIHSSRFTVNSGNFMEVGYRDYKYLFLGNTSLFSTNLTDTGEDFLVACLVSDSEGLEEFAFQLKKDFAESMGSAVDGGRNLSVQLGGATYKYNPIPVSYMPENLQGFDPIDYVKMEDAPGYKLYTISRSGGYYSTAGDWVADESLFSKCTDLIRVTAGDNFRYTGCGMYAAASVLWYDSNNTLLSYEQHGADMNTATLTVTAPENASYVRFCSFNYGADTVELEVITQLRNDVIPDGVGGSSGSGGVSSWNDLTDKPFYEESSFEEILPETELSFVNHYGLYKADTQVDYTKLKLGQTYTMIWDGVTYTAPAFVTSEQAEDGETVTIVAIGNPGIDNIGEDNGIPFYGCNSYSGGAVTDQFTVVSTDTADTHTLSISADFITIKTLDEKFIPNSKPDWDQSDPEASDYVKNKTHYKQLEPDVTIIDISYSPEYYYGVYKQDILLDKIPILGEVYSVRAIYTTNTGCELKRYDDYLWYLGNLTIAPNDAYTGEDTGENVLILFQVSNGQIIPGSIVRIYTLDTPDGGYSRPVSVIGPSVVYYPLDKKYLPDEVNTFMSKNYVQSINGVTPTLNGNVQIAPYSTTENVDFISGIYTCHDSGRVDSRNNKIYETDIIEIEPVELVIGETYSYSAKAIDYSNSNQVNLGTTDWVLKESVEGVLYFANPAMADLSDDPGDASTYSLCVVLYHTNYIVTGFKYCSVYNLYDPGYGTNLTLSGPRMKYVQLDEKFIPDTIARVEDVVAMINEALSGVTGGASMFASTARGRIPEYEKGTALSEFTLDFESSAVGALQEG